MRVAVRGDIHLGLVSDGVPRLEEQRRVLRHTVEFLRDVKPEVFVDLGDVFDSPRPSPAAYEVAAEYFSGLASWAEASGGSAYVLTGNHDKPTRGLTHALSPLAAVTQRVEWWPRIVGTPEMRIHDSGWTTVALVFLPYVTDWEARRGGWDGAQAMLDAFDEHLGGSHRVLVFTHLEVPDASLAGDERVQRDVGTSIPRLFLNDPNLRIFAGHVHRAQEVGNVSVVGSALHVNFGEAADDKRMLLVEVS